MTPQVPWFECELILHSWW